MALAAPWATPDDMATTSCAAADPDDPKLLAALLLASEVLYALSGSVWPGVATDTVRPCSPLRGSGRGWCGCGGPTSCSCEPTGAVYLPGTPAVSVERVWVDGVELPDGGYRVMSDGMLVRTDGQRWPCCQDWGVDGDQPGAFQVTYKWGAEPPPVAVHMAAVLGCELFKASCEDKSCRLPQRVTTVTRQGVTFAVLDPLTLFGDGLTGVAEVDLWLASLRRAVSSRPSAVIVPGARQRNRRDA